MWAITNTIAALLIPPGCLLLIAACGFLWVRTRPRAGTALVAFALVAFYALSTPWVADELLQWFEPVAADPLRDTSAQAIVVLGGGKYYAAPEYGGDTISEAALVRLRYAAHLYRVTRKPIMVSGGSPEGSPTPEARAMKTTLEQDFQVPVKWAEETSNTTLENARISQGILSAQGVRRIYLVTHAWHMPRAQMVFEHAGFFVIPAPTAYTTRYELTVLDFLPNAHALENSSQFFHEVIGIAWYRLKFALGR